MLGHNIDGVASLTLLQTLTTAQNNAETTLQRRFGLASDEFIVLLENNTALRVTEDGPGDTAVLKLLGRDLAREGAIGLIEDILCSYLDALA